MIELALTIFASLAAVVVGIFTIRKAMGWLFPIRIKPSMFMSYANQGRDEIRATVINRSREPLYIVRCRGRSAQTIGHIIRSHLKRPFTKPSLYPCIWFGPVVFDMMPSESVKIEPDQPITFTHHLSFSLPIFAFTTPKLQVELMLSNGRRFRSSRMQIPDRWHVTHQINRHKNEKEPNTKMKADE
jgi:hypothetical protein